MRSERPTILQIIPELDTGGAELSTLEIVAAVADAGGRALVASEGGRMAARIEAVGGEFIPFAAATKNPMRILFNARMLSRLIRQKNIDLVHARSRAPAWSGYLAAQQTGTAFVTTYHGAYSEKNALKKRYNKVMASGEITIANSNYTANLVRSRYDLNDQSLRVIYRGLDSTEFDPANVSEERRSAIRTAWSITPDTQIVLLVARLSPIKGQSVVIKAAEDLSKRGCLENTKVIFAGDTQGRDGYVRQLETQIADAGLSNTVAMVGHVEDIPAAFSLSHTAVFSSTRPETFGRTAIEAQAMRCPIIATAIGAAPETVLAEPAVDRDQKTGWLIAPGDPRALADALADSLIMTAEERNQMGTRARRHVIENFSLDTMRRKTLAVYDDVLGSQLVKAWNTRHGAPRAPTS